MIRAPFDRSGADRRVTTLVALLLFLAASQAAAATKVIRFGKLIDGTGRGTQPRLSPDGKELYHIAPDG